MEHKPVLASASRDRAWPRTPLVRAAQDLPLAVPANLASLPDRRLGAASGWISTVFGLLQFCAPRAFASAVGMRYPPALIRTVGARDFVLGVGILTQPESPGWRWTRAISDVMDVALVGAAAFAPSSRRRLAAFAVLAGGVVAFDIFAARHRASLSETLCNDNTADRGS